MRCCYVVDPVVQIYAHVKYVIILCYCKALIFVFVSKSLDVIHQQLLLLLLLMPLLWEQMHREWRCDDTQSHLGTHSVHSHQSYSYYSHSTSRLSFLWFRLFHPPLPDHPSYRIYYIIISSALRPTSSPHGRAFHAVADLKKFCSAFE